MEYKNDEQIPESRENALTGDMLDVLESIVGADSYLHELATKNSSDRLKTAQNDAPDDYIYPETMQERADAIRKNDSAPE